MNDQDRLSSGDALNLPAGNLSRDGMVPGPGVVRRPQVRRRLSTGGAGPSLPTVAGGVAYLGDADGNVCALDVESGAVLWQHRHDLRHDDGTAALSSVAGLPAVSADLVLAEAGEQIFAHDRVTGRLLWPIPEISSHHGVVAAGVVLVLHGLEAAAAYDLATGARRWTSEQTVTGDGHYGFGLLAAPAPVVDGCIFVTEGVEGNHTHGGLHAFDVAGGARLWGFHDTTAPCGHPGCEGTDLMLAPYRAVHARGLIWAVRSRWCDHDSQAVLELAGFDPLTGQERASFAEPEGSGCGEIFGAAPVFGEDLVYCTSGQAVHAVDPGSGLLRWTSRFSAPVVATPLLAGDTLHVACEGGQVHAVHAGTGAPRWDLTLEEPTSWQSAPDGEYDEVAAPITLAGGVLYAATDNAVLALS